MRIYHVAVEREAGMYAARALEDPALITQGRTLDEVIINVRDAAALLRGEKAVQVELILPPTLKVGTQRSMSPRRRNGA